MSEMTASAATDEIELPDELPAAERVSVMRIHHIGIELPPERLANAIKARGGKVQPMFHIAWEALSFKYDFNPEVFDDQYEHQWLTIFTNDGNLMGPTSQFGVVKESFKTCGYALTKNSVFQPQLTNTIWKTKLVSEKWQRKDKDGNVEREGTSWNTLVVEQLPTYTPPSDPRVIKRGYGGGSSGIKAAEPSTEQIAAVKVALNGKSEDEYVDAIMFSGNPLVAADPFLAEAGDPARLTERMLRYGGKVVSGRLFFGDLS